MSTENKKRPLSEILGLNETEPHRRSLEEILGVETTGETSMPTPEYNNIPASSLPSDYSTLPTSSFMSEQEKAKAVINPNDKRTQNTIAAIGAIATVQQEHLDKMATDPAYRDEYFQSLGYWDADDYREKTANKLEAVLKSIEGNVPDNRFGAKPLSETAIYEGGLPYRSGEEIAAGRSLAKVRSAINTLRSNNFWSGLGEGFDLADFATLGFMQVGDNVVALEALNKAAKGEELDSTEQALVDSWKLGQQVENEISLLGGRSVGAGIGRGVGESLPFLTEMVATGGVAAAATKGISKAIAKNAVKKSAKELLQEGSQQVAKKLSKDRIVSGLQQGGLRLAESVVGNAVRVPLTGGAYKNYTGKRLEQFVLDGDDVKKYTTSAWKDALKAGFETFMEYQSEDVGNWIGAPLNRLGGRLAHSSIGKALRLDRIADYKGNAGLTWLRDQAKITNFVGETLGEAYGDAIVNLFENNKDGWRQMLTKEYWWQLGGVSMILQGAFSLPGVVSTDQINYNRRVSALNDIKKNTLSNIKNDELRATLTKAAAAPTIEQRSEMLKGINWNDRAISKSDGFNAVKFINAQTAFDITDGEASETERIQRFFPIAEYLENRVYMGKDGREDTNDIVEIADKNGNTYTVIKGDLDTPDAILKAQDAQGKVWDIPMTDVKTVERKSLADAVAVSYAMMFNTQANQELLDRLQTKVSDAVAMGVSTEEVKQILDENGVVVFNSGDAVETVNGEQGTVVAMDGDHYFVEITDGTGVTDVRPYGINEIVQPKQTQAEAMEQATAGATASAENVVGSTPEEQAVENVVAQAERVIDEQIEDAVNVADGNIYNCVLEDGTEVVIRNGYVVLTEDGDIDITKSDATIVVEHQDGRKQTIAPQRIAYIASTESAEQAKGNAHEQLRGVVSEQERQSNISVAISNGEPVITADGRQGVVSVAEDGTMTIADADGDTSAITIEDITDVAKPTESATESTPEVVEPETESSDNPLTGRSLTEEEATSVIARMQENAAPDVELELTPENWLAEFGETGMVDTPIGKVKMGEHQIAKLFLNKRNDQFGLIKPTLQSPDVIIEKTSPEDGAERDSKFLFIKTFRKSDGEQFAYFESVTVQKEGFEVSISSHRVDVNAIQKEMQNQKILHLNEKLLFSSDGYLTKPQEEGSDLVPTPNNISSENKDTTSAPEIQIPRLKNGEVDYNAMSPEMFKDYFLEQFGEDALIKLARNNIKAVDKTLNTVTKKIENLVDPNKMASLTTQLLNASRLRKRYEDILELVGVSEVEENDTDRAARLKQESTPRIVQLFPDGLPNAESVVLADIATGKKIRWSDLERNGSVVSRGLGAELGLLGSNKERNKRIALLSNNAPTPEQYAEELPERLNAMGIRYDESALRDIILDAYASVDTRAQAWEALENIAQDTASDVPMDYEDAQMKANYEREQRELNGTSESAPVIEESESATIGDAELSTEEAVPFSLKEDVGLVTDDFTATLSEQEASFIDALARALGVKVEFVDVIPGADANAAIIGKNVLIRKKNRTKAVKFLVGHEFTHRMQDLSPAAYTNFKEAVKAYLGKRFDPIVARLVRNYQAQGVPYTMELIEDEVVADFAGEIALKTTVFDNFLKANAENKSLWQVILDVLRSIRDSFAGLFSSKQERALLHAINKLEDLLEVSSEKAATEQSVTDERYSLKEVNDNFNEQLATLTEENKDKVNFSLGMPSDILLSAGVANKPMKLYGAKVVKKQKMHGFKLDELKDLPMAVANPIAVFNNYQRADNRSILTELKTKDGNFLVSLNVGKDQEIDFNIVATVFGKDGDKIIDWFAKGYATYVNKEKALNYLHHSAPIAEALRNPRLNTITKIVQNFENPTIGPKNSLKGIDDLYLDAVNRGDMAMAQRMVQEAAEHAGYLPDTSYQGSLAFNGAAPTSNVYFETKEERKQAWDNEEFDDTMSLGDYADNGIDTNDLEWRLTNAGNYRRATQYEKESIDNINKALKNPERKITIYRAVPNSVVEGSVRNGDWVTPSRSYAEYHIGLQDWEGGRVIEQEVSIDDIWWGGDDINEWGYDDGSNYGYRNTENNRKLLDTVTYDDAGNIIPLSERFNPEKADVRYSIKDEDTSAIMNSAKEEFEATDDWGVTGWLLPDGTQLSFAEEESFERDIDHRAIGRAYIGSPDERWQYLQDFERRGGIRISANYGEGTIEMMVAPTPEQMRKISSFSRYESGNISIDFMDDNYNTVHSVYYENTNPSRISADIDRYFDEGIKPIGNVRFSLKDEATEKIFATAKTKFGTTYDMREAGWILPDGSMLDFSGKHEIQDADTSFLNGRRSVDHRAIQDIAYDFDENETGVKTDLGDFLDRGAIRIDYNAGSINLNVAPTKAQKDRLRRLIERNDGDVYIDFGKGWDTEHYVEYESARPTRVLGDIDRYFDEGIKPTGNVQYSLKDTFYSNAENAVRNIKQEKATPEQWLKMIEKNGGLKAGEDKWLGLSDWLKASDKKTLTKDEVMEYINQNQIQIEEVKYREFGPGLIDEVANILTRELQVVGIDGLREKYPDFENYFEVDGNEVLWSENMASEGEYEDYIIEHQITNVNPIDNAINERRLSYTTRGLRNKQEIALVVPTIEPWNASDKIHFGDAGNGRVVAWVRFGETTDTEGNRVLVIDEIQSKRHQEGREKGYRDGIIESYKRRGYKIIRNASDNGWLVFEGDKFFDRVLDRENRGVPSAPFEKNWAELAMKRMLRYAAENGYDKVAWTTGEQQAERYNLGAVMTGLKAYKTYSGEYYVMPYNNGAIGEFTKEYTEKELADTFGKELATNIITNAENATEENPYEIEGENLRFGGSGMKTFYDTMLVNFMNKYGKKWGVKVGEVTMPELEENNTMHSVNVTPAMRESVMQGQPMFSLRGLSAEEQEIIKTAKSNGSYLKAPNGADSNLTPRQWVQVRTKAFKEWFGDWEKAARIEKLRKSESVSITGEEIVASDDMKEYRKNALEYGKAFRGEYINADTGNAIIINKDSLTEVLHHDGSNIAHIQSIAAIPQMVESGIYIDSEPIGENASKRLRNAKMAHYYVCGLNIGGTPCTVKFVIAEFESGEKYYDHSLTEIEKGELLNRAEVSSTVAESKTPISDIKDKRIISILQTNSSKVVDANGEPKVVYNGSKVQHYNYDGRLRTKGQSATNSKVSFFTDSRAVAERYGEFVNEVFLNIRNPYEVDYKGAGWQGWSGAEDGMQRMSTDSYADLLANGTYDSTLGAIIENYGRAEADYLATGKVFNEGIEPDGVIAYNVADPMRSTLYIVRNAEAKDLSRESVTPKGVETFTKLGKSSLLFDSQIKSATDNIGTFEPREDDIRFSIIEQPIDRILDQKRLEFEKLTEEYNALLQNRDKNPNFDEALNEWRDRKAIVLYDYLTAYAQSLGIDHLVTLDIFNTRGDKSEYGPIVDMWMPGLSDEERNEIIDYLVDPEVGGIHIRGTSGILMDMSHSDNRSLLGYETVFIHEFSHLDNELLTENEFIEVYNESSEWIQGAEILKEYRDKGKEPWQLADELLSIAMDHIHRRGALDLFIDGAITVEKTIESLKYSKPLMREILIRKLNRLKDYADKATTERASRLYGNSTLESGWNEGESAYSNGRHGRDLEDVRFSIRNDETPTDALKRAEKMLEELADSQLSPEEIAARIKNETGWERTPNHSWKYAFSRNDWNRAMAPIDAVIQDVITERKKTPLQLARERISQLYRELRSSRKSISEIIEQLSKEIRGSISTDLVEVMGKRDFDNIIRIVEGAVAKGDIEQALRQVNEQLVKLEEASLRRATNKMLSIKLEGTNPRGVSVSRWVDQTARVAINTYKDSVAKGVRAEDLEQEFKDEWQYGQGEKYREPLAMWTAIDLLQHHDDIQRYDAELADIDSEIADIRRQNSELFHQGRAAGQAGNREQARLYYNGIKVNKDIIADQLAERLSIAEKRNGAMRLLVKGLNETIMYGRSAFAEARTRREQEKAAIVSMGFDDCADWDNPTPMQDEELSKGKQLGLEIQEFLTSPGYSMNTALKLISVNAPGGEGALYNHFVKGRRGYLASQAQFYTEYNRVIKEYGDKAQEVFGKPYEQVLNDSDKDSVIAVNISNGKRLEQILLTYGEAMYLYMADKMMDGRVKIRKMGISEEDMDAVAASLPPQYIRFADWVQGEFLPSLRDKYNATHIECFGIPMSEVDNYVPLKVLKSKTYQEVDGSGREATTLPSAITGSIIKRTRNTLPIDLHTNAFEVIRQHVEDMEHWNAYTFVIQDMNALLSSTEFRRMINHLHPGMHKKLKELAQVTTGTYSSEATGFDKGFAALNKVAATSKIAFRINTALKQILSYPAFYAYAVDSKYWAMLTRNISPDVWKRNFTWALKNSPIFRERWEGRTAGNEKLSQATLPAFDKIIKHINNAGMFPNAFIDALTCANGAKAVYDYKLEYYKEHGYDAAEADRLALIDATISLNETQQSSEGLFLSVLQSRRDFFAVAMSTFQNSNFAYLRKQMESIRELFRNRAKQIENRTKYYEKQGMESGKAAELARKDVKDAKLKAGAELFVFSFLLNTMWTLGGKIWQYAFGDDDDREEIPEEALKAFAMSPVRNTTIGSMLESIAGGYGASQALFFTDLQRAIEEIQRVAQNDPKSWDQTAFWLTCRILITNGVGVDLTTFANMYQGIAGMIRDGADVEDVMYILNAPQSQAKLLAGKPKEGETLDEYQKRMAFTFKRFKPDKKDLSRWEKQYIAGQQRKLLIDHGYSFVEIDETNKRFNEVRKIMGVTRGGKLNEDARYGFKHQDTKEQELIRELLRNTRIINAKQKQLERMVDFNDSYLQLMLDIEALRKEAIEKYDKSNK